MGEYFKFRHPSFHILSPDHEIATEKEVEELLRKYHVQRWQLPRIHIDDVAISDLDVVPGDVIKISRRSPTAGVFLAYRYVVDSTIGRDARTLFNPSSLECLFREETTVQEDEQVIALEIIGTLKQAAPPARGLERITVGRDNSMRQFADFFERVTEKDSPKARFVIAEIGQGKSHFLFLLRDEAFKQNLAISLIEVSLVDLQKVYSEVIRNVCFASNLKLGNLRPLFQRLFARIHKLAEEEIEDGGFDPLNYPRLVLIMRKIVKKIQERFRCIDSTYIETIESLFQSILLDGEIREATLTRSTHRARPEESLRAFAELIRVAGFNGLVILVDEVEPDRSRRSYENIKNLIQMNVPGLLWVYTGTADLLIDPDKGINVLDNELYTYVEENKTELEILSIEDYEILMERIITLYDTAHKTKLNEVITSQMKRSFLDHVLKSIEVKQLTPRSFLTNLVTWLDLTRKDKVNIIV